MILNEMLIRQFRPNKNPSISGMDSFRTTNINETTWQFLSRYKSKSFVESKLASELVNNSQLVSIKAEQISAMMTQTEKYFSSAKVASPEIKPLIIYYGMVGLAKILILSGDNAFTLSALDSGNDAHGSHGLTVKPGRGNTLDQQIRDGSGIFDEFCYVASDSSSRNGSGLFNLMRSCYASTEITKRTRISIKELLARIPELYKQYIAQFGEASKTWGCSASFEALGNPIQRIVFEDWFYVTQRGNQQESYRETIERVFPDVTSLYRQEGQEDMFVLNSPATSVDDYIFVSDLLTLEHYAIARFNNFSLTDIDIHFLFMFMLSNLVRYRQDKWAKLLNRVDNGEYYLVEQFISVAETKFPLLILQELDNVNYRFLGQVATWG